MKQARKKVRIPFLEETCQKQKSSESSPFREGKVWWQTFPGIFLVHSLKNYKLIK